MNAKQYMDVDGLRQPGEVREGRHRVGVNWNGSICARAQEPDDRYGYPKEGYPIWMDNVGV
jgi:spermidine/putrescine transport system substrate-binding protein